MLNALGKKWKWKRVFKWRGGVTLFYGVNKETEIMASGPITSWQIDGETVETVAEFIFGGSKITADGDCSHEIKRRLLLGRKVMTNLDSILKGRDITLPTKVRLVKAVVFLVVMYGCESWTLKKAELRRMDAFELWCWRRLLRVPLTARRSNQSILKEISPEYSLEDWCWSWNSYTLVTWCEELTHWKRPWCWERLKAGEGDDRGWDGWIASLTQWTWVWVNFGSWWWTGKPGVLRSMGLQSVRQDWATELNRESLIRSWCHLTGDLREGGNFPGWGKGRSRRPEMTCVFWNSQKTSVAGAKWGEVRAERDGFDRK